MLVKLLIVTELAGERHIAKFTHRIANEGDLKQLTGYNSDLPIFASVELGDLGYDPKIVNSINAILDAYKVDFIYKDQLEGFCYIMKKLGYHVEER